MQLHQLPWSIQPLRPQRRMYHPSSLLHGFHPKRVGLKGLDFYGFFYLNLEGQTQVANKTWKNLDLMMWGNSSPPQKKSPTAKTMVSWLFDV